MDRLLRGWLVGSFALASWVGVPPAYADTPHAPPPVVVHPTPTPAIAHAETAPSPAHAETTPSVPAHAETVPSAPIHVEPPHSAPIHIETAATLALRARLQARTQATAHPVAVPSAPTAAPGRIQPITDRSELLEPKAEKAVRLQNARVVLADYPLITHDFGKALEARFGKPVESISHDEIDSWLLESTAYISVPQSKQTTVNTPIPYDPKQTVSALRPQDYGRALVYNPTPGVFIDVKGAGAKKPALTDHASGLATLGEGIREYAYEHLVHKVLQHANRGDRTVGHYAVIDAGFDVKQPDGRTDPAGLILRQAHSRSRGDLAALGNHDTKRVEATLRRYGITSAGAYQEEPYDALNLQGTKDGALVDFGGFLVESKFEKPAYHFDRTPDASPKYKPLLSTDKVWVEPNPALRVPVEQWGFTVSGKADPAVDNPSIWSHELARSLREGRATRNDAEQHLHNLLDPVDARLNAQPGPSSPTQKAVLPLPN
jgi:hypothetical protein